MLESELILRIEKLLVLCFILLLLVSSLWCRQTEEKRPHRTPHVDLYFRLLRKVFSSLAGIQSHGWIEKLWKPPRNSTVGMKTSVFCSLIYICTIWRFSRTINVNLHQLKNRIRFHTKHHDSCHDIVAVVVVIVPSRLIAGSLLFTISILNVH